MQINLPKSAANIILSYVLDVRKTHEDPLFDIFLKYHRIGLQEIVCKLFNASIRCSVVDRRWRANMDCVVFLFDTSGVQPDLFSVKNKELGMGLNFLSFLQVIKNMICLAREKMLIQKIEEFKLNFTSNTFLNSEPLYLKKEKDVIYTNLAHYTAENHQATFLNLFASENAAFPLL